MNTSESGAAPVNARSPVDEAWDIVLAAARSAEDAETASQRAAFALGSHGRLRPVPFGQVDAVLAWHPDSRWDVLLADTDARRPLIDLYLPICGATRVQPITVGHLGQSLDGFIAMPSGESQNVTGDENILHLHRLRALCDAIIVGAGTVAADDPQLTTRHVDGPSPLRVVLDPGRRLGAHYKVFTDETAETLCVAARSLLRPGETHVGRASLLGLDGSSDGIDAVAVLAHLRRRGCARIFVEGGGVTVSAFLEAGVLDRLQVAVAPLIIGDGVPAIRLPARQALSECQRPRCRLFRMGADVLFDCDLSAPGPRASTTNFRQPGLARIS